MDRFSHHAGQISLVGFCIFGNSHEATEGSRVPKMYTRKSSNGEIYFLTLGRVHGGFTGFMGMVYEPKKSSFFAFFSKKSKVQIL